MATNDSYDEHLDNDVVQKLAGAVRTELPHAAQLQRIKQRIMENIRTRPAAGSFTVRELQGNWQPILQGIEIKLLSYNERAETQTALWRCQPGASLPGHSHSCAEEILVLEGDLRFGKLTLNAGDFHYMDPNSCHEEASTVSGCLLYIRGDLNKRLLSSSPTI